MTSGRPAFQQHVKHAEGNDTTPRLAHSESTERRVYKPQLRQKRKRSRSPAGPRRLGTATRISASLSRRLSAFFESTSWPRSQSGKVRRSGTRPGDVRERAVRVEGSDSGPVRKARVSPCEPLCAILLRKPSVYPLSLVKANVGRLCRRY